MSQGELNLNYLSVDFVYIAFEWCILNFLKITSSASLRVQRYSYGNIVCYFAVNCSSSKIVNDACRAFGVQTVRQVLLLLSDMGSQHHP